MTAEGETYVPKVAPGVKVYFNPFAFTIEQNNEFIRLGYEPLIFMPSDLGGTEAPK